MSGSHQADAQKRMVLFLCVLFFAIVATLSVLLMTGAGQTDADARLAATPAIKSAPAGDNETEAYRQLLDEQNLSIYQQASEQGESMVATLSASPFAQRTVETVRQERIADVVEPGYRQVQPEYSSGLHRAGMLEEMRAVMANWKPMPHAVVLTRLARPVVPQPADTGPSVPEPDQQRRILIEGGSVMYARLETAINSDYPGTVSAVIRGGHYDGARLLGGFRQIRERVVLEFNRMNPGRGEALYAIRAVGVDPDASLPSLAGNVDHHILRNYILPAAARFAVGLGRVASQEQRSVIHSPLGGATVVHGDSSLQRELKVAAAEVGTGIVSDIADTRRPPTVRVPAGQDFAVLFLEDVYRTAVVAGEAPSAGGRGQVSVQDAPDMP